MADQNFSVDQFRRAFAGEQNGLLDAAMLKVSNCVRQLSGQQVWWRAASDQNSVANLIIHVCGNMTQWILSGVGGELDNRDRESEFAATSGLTQSELLERLESVIGRVRQVIEDTPTDQLLANRTVQGFEVTGMGAIVHSVTHFVGHTHQIIQLTRLQLGDAYRFAWSPDAGKTSLPI
jgi:uncharacterized damage-inducible protein DinB